jgi:membrane protease YdiL (CAAX protease family)
MNPKIEKLRRTLLVVGCVIATAVASFAAYRIERLSPGNRHLIALGTASGFGLLLFLGIRCGIRAYSIHRVGPAFSARNFSIGAAIGAAVFAVSAISLMASYTWENAGFSYAELLRQCLFQTRPAVLEEIGFRMGAVTFAWAFYGAVGALIAGSVPFGALHLLNLFSGGAIDAHYILGTSVAGLFLSLVFLNFGLAASLAAHYVWNVFAAVSSRHLPYSQEELEGGPATLLVLVTASVFLAIRRFRNGFKAST